MVFVQLTPTDSGQPSQWWVRAAAVVSVRSIPTPTRGDERCLVDLGAGQSHWVEGSAHDIALLLSDDATT